MAQPYLCFPGIHDCPVYIKDEPTFRMAKILWNEIEKIYAKPEPVVIKPPIVLPQLVSAPQPEAEKKEPDEFPPLVHHITRGDKVRHITAYPLFPGIGTVVKISSRGDEVLVDFGNGTEWTDRKNLEVVPAEAKVVVSVP